MTKRRGHGEGAVYFDESVRLWRGVVDLGRDLNGKRRRARVSGRTKTEARERLREVQRQKAAGLAIGDARYTVADLLRDWLREGLPGRSLNTLDNYKWAVEHHLVPALGHRRLRDLTPDDVAAMLQDRAAQGMSRSSLNRMRSVLAAALRFAERRGRVMRNVASLVDTPQGPVKDGRALTVDQAKALLDAVRDDRIEALVVTGLMAGLRPGELLGLTWTDVNVDAAVLHVRQSLKRERTGHRLGEPKTSRSRRSIDLPSPVVEALKAHRVRQAAERLAAGTAWTDLDLVFCTEVGTPIDHSNLRRAFARATEGAGIGRWHPHELRHSTASILSAAAVPLEVIADLLGHDGTRMTGQVYRHAVMPTVSAAVQPMNALFGTA